MPYLIVQSQQWKHQNNVWNLFKVNKKDTSAPFLYPLKTSENFDFLTFSGGIEMEHCCLYCWLWIDFTDYFGVSIVDFEQVYTSWVVSCHHTSLSKENVSSKNIFSFLIIQLFNFPRHLLNEKHYLWSHVHYFHLYHLK